MLAEAAPEPYSARSRTSSFSYVHCKTLKGKVLEASGNPESLLRVLTTIPARRHRQFWRTGSSVLILRLDFGAFEAPSCAVIPTFWSSGKVQKRQKDPGGRAGNVPEGTESAEMPRRSGVRTEVGAFAKIVVFLCK